MSRELWEEFNSLCRSANFNWAQVHDVLLSILSEASWLKSARIRFHFSQTGGKIIIHDVPFRLAKGERSPEEKAAMVEFDLTESQINELCEKLFLFGKSYNSGHDLVDKEIIYSQGLLAMMQLPPGVF